MSRGKRWRRRDASCPWRRRDVNMSRKSPPSKITKPDDTIKNSDVCEKERATCNPEGQTRDAPRIEHVSVWKIEQEKRYKLPIW